MSFVYCKQKKNLSVRIEILYNENYCVLLRQSLSILYFCSALPDYFQTCWTSSSSVSPFSPFLAAPTLSDKLHPLAAVQIDQQEKLENLGSDVKQLLEAYNNIVSFASTSFLILFQQQKMCDSNISRTVNPVRAIRSFILLVCF